MPLAVFPRVLKFHLIVLNSDLLRLKMLEQAPLLQVALEVAPHVVIRTASRLWFFVVAHHHAVEKLFQSLRRAVCSPTANGRPLQGTIIAGQHRLRDFQHGRCARKRQFPSETLSALLELSLDVAHQRLEVLGIYARKYLAESAIRSPAQSAQITCVRGIKRYTDVDEFAARDVVNVPEHRIGIRILIFHARTLLT